jgi:pimeloyl-ACP methyl ester carboxylesterase
MRPRGAKAIVLSFAVIAVVSLASAGFRYYRYAACVRMLSEAVDAHTSVSEGVRRDVAAHAQYLRERLDRGWLFSKRDLFLGALLLQVSRFRDATLHARGYAYLLAGHHVIATTSTVDGVSMPTSVTVPEGFGGAGELPLVLHLHSGGVREMLDCFPAPAIAGAVSAMPLARGSHDYLGVQMTAVVEILADLRRRYEPPRVFVMGTSMGGMGAWLLAERMPDEIDGVSPWCANADPDAWQGVWEDPRAQAGSASGRAWRVIRESRTPLASVGRLATESRMPVYIGHGTEDTKIPIGHSESMYKRLHDAGVTVRFDRFEGYGHRLPAMVGERFAWMLEHASAETTGQANAALAVPAGDDADAFAALRDLAESRHAARSGHTPSGPACTAFERSFAVVAPAGAPAHVDECIDELALIWRERYGGEIRRIDHTPPRLQDDAGMSLVAVGSPDENPAVREALRGVDVALSRGEARLCGRVFRGEDVGVIMLRPDASALGGPVLVVWGSTPESYRQVWRRFTNSVDWEGDRWRWWFDYAVFDRRSCGPDTLLAAGFFDREGSFSPALLFEGDTDLRERIPGSNWAVSIGSGEAMHLSSLAPTAIHSLRGPVGFDRSAAADAGALTIQGTKYERGIGMVPPTSLTWDVAGRFSSVKATVGLERTESTYGIRYDAERVRFEIWGDGKLLAVSQVLSAGSPGVELVANLTGVAVLELRAVATTTQVWHYGPVGWGGLELSE